MAIQASGVGSGLDINNIISQLVALERRPLNNLDTKTETINAQISAYGSLKSKLSDFQTAMDDLSGSNSFKVFQTSSANDAIFSATADSSAVAGSYAINVAALAERDKIATKAFTDSNSIVGEGTLTISSGTNSFDVAINATNSSAAGIRDAINSATDNSGVTATIVTDDAGAHLVLSSDNTGTANALKITVAGDSDGNNTDDAGLSSLAFDTGGGVVHRPAISTAADSVVEIDGFTVTSSSNTISTALEGVAISAKSLGASTLNITRDDTAIQESVQKFADSYNALRTEINTQRAGELEGDNTLLIIERQLADVLSSGTAITGSSFSYLIDVGISVDKNGKMSVDSSAITNTLNSDFSSFVNLFSATDEGIASRFHSLADNWLATDGLIKDREKGLSSRIDSIDKQRGRFESRLQQVERRLRAQFTAMDTLVSNLNATGSFLTQQLASIPARR